MISTKYHRARKNCRINYSFKSQLASFNPGSNFHDLIAEPSLAFKTRLNLRWTKSCSQTLISPMEDQLVLHVTGTDFLSFNRVSG